MLKLNDEINRAMASPDVSEKLVGAGLIVVTEPPEFFADAVEGRLCEVRQAGEGHRLRSPMSESPRYEPFGWHHWPEHFFMSYQFRRALGETQEGGGAVSEVFQAASRMKPGDAESWHVEWLRIAERN